MPINIVVLSATQEIEATDPHPSPYSRWRECFELNTLHKLFLHSTEIERCLGDQRIAFTSENDGLASKYDSNRVYKYEEPSSVTSSYRIVPICWSCTVARLWLVIWETMLETFHMLFVALMTGTLLPGVNSTLESSTVAQRVAESIHLGSQSAHHNRLHHRSQASQ
jgi:hypothetical protein